VLPDRDNDYESVRSTFLSLSTSSRAPPNWMSCPFVGALASDHFLVAHTAEDAIALISLTRYFFCPTSSIAAPRRVVAIFNLARWSAAFLRAPIMIFLQKLARIPNYQAG